MIRKLTFLPLLAMMLFFSSCEEENEQVPVIDSVSAPMPLLAEGNKIGTIIGFNPSNPPETTDSIEDRWDEAVQAGMQIGRLQIDWPELEPQPGVYDKEALENRLKEYDEQNLQTFLLISAYDSEDPVVPSDLEGLKFNDPELIDRFNKLMNWVIPMLVEYNGYIISISNEADNSFGELPNLHNEILTFLKEVKTHIHSINENMAVTVTIAEGNLGIGKPGIKEIVKECDVACWNFYGSEFIAEAPYYLPQDEAEIRKDIQRMLDYSGEKQIVIQELGMWSGSDVLSSSNEIQRKFFEIFFSEMKKEDRIRAAYVFQLVDWSPEVTDMFLQLFEGEELPPVFIDALAESLKTIGLIRYSDGKRRPAWNEFIKWLEEFA
jgi:hypothetical protein